MRRGVSNIPRDVAIYLLRKYRLDTLNAIGSLFGIAHCSTVSNSISRVKISIIKAYIVVNDIVNIEKSINISQEKI